MKLIAGVDEAGRGPLAGPVVAAAVILPEEHGIEGLRDSKKLSEKRREALFSVISENSISLGTGIIHENEIDNTDILSATRKAMRIAIGKLNPQPDESLIDGYALPDQIVKNRGIIGGDDKVPVISAASIIAKVTRDRMMRNYHDVFPEYNFAQHKGYGTREHLENLRKYLACPIHRKSFNPVKKYLPTLSNLKKERMLGKWGERLAARYLIHNGYEIVEMNYNAAPYGEIDIVAWNMESTIFVEVKTASQTKLGDPESQVDEKKIEKLENVFEIYTSRHDQEGEFRFDIITVLLGKGKPKIQHFIDCLN